MNAPDDLPDDELVSAVLDGEADAATRARVEGDPTLAGRLAEFAAVRDDVRAFTVPDGLLDDLRRAAVAQHAIEAAATPASAPPAAAPVRSLAAARARRTKAASWIGAAAAAVVLIAAIGLTAGNGGDGRGEATSAAFDARGTGSSGTGSRAAAATQEAAPTAGAATGASGTAGGSGAKSAGAGTGAGPTSSAAAPVRDLGPVPDVEALARAYRAPASDDAAPTSTAAAAAGAPSTTCGTPTAVARLAGRAVVLLAAPAQVSVLDAGTCTVLATFVP